MWTVVEIGKKQYIASKGEVLTVERLSGTGAVEFDKVLLIADGDEVKVGKPYIAGALIKATIESEFRGEKVLSYKCRRRKKSRRIRGHRQYHTKVKIDDIVV